MRLFLTCFGIECYRTWRQEMLASVLVVIAGFFVSCSMGDPEASKDLLSALLAAGLALGAFAVWHLVRAPWLLHKEMTAGAAPEKKLYEIFGMLIITALFGGPLVGTVYLWRLFSHPVPPLLLTMKYPNPPTVTFAQAPTKGVTPHQTAPSLPVRAAEGRPPLPALQTPVYTPSATPPGIPPALAAYEELKGVVQDVGGADYQWQNGFTEAIRQLRYGINQGGPPEPPALAVVARTARFDQKFTDDYWEPIQKQVGIARRNALAQMKPLTINEKDRDDDVFRQAMNAADTGVSIETDSVDPQGYIQISVDQRREVSSRFTPLEKYLKGLLSRLGDDVKSPRQP